MLAQARKIFERNADRDKLRARVTSLSTELVEEREKLAEKADEVEGLWGAHAELEDVKRKLESDQRLLKIWRDRHTEADKVVQSSRREAYGLRTAVSILKEDRKVPLSDRHFNEENWPCESMHGERCSTDPRGVADTFQISRPTCESSSGS
jgi:predicted nuclease with TOPRIM domain